AAQASGNRYDVFILADHGQVATQPFEQVMGAPLREHVLAQRSLERERTRLERELVCVEAGDLAHVYLTREKEPLSLAAIQARYPRLLEVLLRCRAIGVVVARGGKRGLAFHKGRVLDLSEPGALASLGLGYPSERVQRALTEMLAMPSAGDL